MTALAPFRGASPAARRAMITGAIGLIATLVGFAVAPRQTLFSYLAAYSCWCTIVVGALCWLLALRAAGARWPVTVIRPLELLAANGLPLIVLFIPIAAGMKILYPWAAPDPARGPHFLELMRHKSAWLNPAGFVLRALVYLLVFTVVGTLLLRHSLRQDEDGGPDWRPRMRRLSSAVLPAVGLCVTFAALDWLMSLTPEWYSTIYGVYWFAGGFVTADALWILCVIVMDARGLLPGLVRPSHYHSMGKLLLAFVCFWAYIGFAQLLLIWIADLPEEITFYAARRGGWLGVSLALAIGHFVLPFLALLSRDLKRDPRRLGWVALWIVIMHWVDSWWLVIPTLRTTPMVTWQDLAATAAMGGAGVAWTLFRFQGRLPAPVKDPAFAESARYDK